jgi:hypothetical protein
MCFFVFNSCGEKVFSIIWQSVSFAIFIAISHAFSLRENSTFDFDYFFGGITPLYQHQLSPSAKTLLLAFPIQVQILAHPESLLGFNRHKKPVTMDGSFV